MVRAVLAVKVRRKAARSFEISASCVVIYLMQQWETTGHCLPRKFGGHKRHALAEYEDKVRALVAAQPHLTITALWEKADGARHQSRAVRRRTLFAASEIDL